MRIYKLHLARLKTDLSSPVLERVLESLSESIQASAEAIKSAGNNDFPEYEDCIIDDETEVIESLIGVALVATHTQITAITSHIKKLHKCFEINTPGGSLSTTNGTKNEILAFGGNIVDGTGYTQIQIIDAFANYFKHRVEWPAIWTKLNNQQAITAAIIQAAGASEGSTGNLRVGATKLGLNWERTLLPLSEYVSVWRSNLARAYEEELNRKGVL